MKRLNILLILADQFRYDCLSCLEHSVVRTPNLDDLAGESLLFENAYAATMACGPSRASIFTGLHSDRHGQIANQVPLDPPEIVGFPQLLRDSGYETGLVGKLHLKPIRRDYGFDYCLRHDGCQDNYDPDEPRTSAYVSWLSRTAYAANPEAPVLLASADEACMLVDEERFALGSDWIIDEIHHETVWTARNAAEFISRKRERPFFLQCSFFGPHQPYQCPGRWGKLYDPGSIPMPRQFNAPIADKPVLQESVGGILERRRAAGWDESTYQRLLAAYYGNISMIDHYIGEVLSALRRAGAWDNTMIIFAADHGDYAGQFKLLYKKHGYEGSAHVPMMIRDPRGRRYGQRESSVVSSIDLFATLLAAADLSVPDDSDSRDLGPLLRGEASNWPNNAWFKAGNDSMVIEENFKLIRGLNRDGDRAYELYDLNEVPRDWTNRIEKLGRKPKVASMKKRLDEFCGWLDGISESRSLAADV